VGLGNPGKRYAATRHNIGFMIIDAMAKTYSANITDKIFDTVFGKTNIDGIDAVLAKPMNFMNRSGPPVSLLSKKMGICVKDMLVIHDDMDLEFGRIKIKEKGGHGGHRGIISLLDALGDDSFSRLRIGIGRPKPDTDAIEHVLGNFTETEQDMLNQVIDSAREAAVSVLCKGTRESMNVFNGKTQHLT